MTLEVQEKGAVRTEKDILLESRDVRKFFGAHSVLKGISLTVKKGETVALLGPSGSGKTTFLRCLNFLEQADAGILKIGNMEVNLQSVHKKEILLLRRRTAMVFQGYNLFSHKTALENVIEGPVIVQKRPKKECIEEAEAYLEMVGMIDRRNHYPSQLSGGQQQRVAIARAMALRPDIILLDEPTSALDPELVEEVLSVISKLACQGMTMIIVTHEMQFAYDVATEIAIMDKGMIIEQGSPSRIFRTPTEERTRQFLNRVMPMLYNYSI
ncbi:amino acid ABC transporter ATP-binding protein [Oxalobacter aliiformigenes]|nr:amino acid ABC transporter ATP-binding protein [Oxalobacter aliiformigenes]